MDVRFRSMPAWPHPSTPPERRRYRPFKSSWNATLQLLERELGNLGGRNILIGCGLRERDIRVDGWPRSDANLPPFPGVEISFDSRHGRLTYATDVCSEYQDNVRSIALGLEALRAVDRFGVAVKGQQYAGWRALPAGPSGDDLPETFDDALEVVAGVLGPEARHPMSRSQVLSAIQKTHPDHGGDPRAFRRVQRAKAIIESAAPLLESR